MNLVGREQSGAHIKHSSVVLRQPLAPDGIMPGFTLGRGRPVLNPNASTFMVPGISPAADTPALVDESAIADQYQDAPEGGATL